MPSNKLYVGNLSYEVSEQDLSTLFSNAGSVTSAKIITDRMSGRSKGFGFVEMATEEEAQKAIAMYNGYALKGRELKVNEARPQAPRGEFKPRSGFRGGRSRF